MNTPFGSIVKQKHMTSENSVQCGRCNSWRWRGSKPVCPCIHDSKYTRRDKHVTPTHQYTGVQTP